jgi:penicillin-binding protein 2
MNNRKVTFYFIFFLVGFIFAARLFYLQVIDTSYKLSAENNVIRTIRLFPPRGFIFDRNEKLLVFNQPAYDLMVVPKQVPEIDTNAFCELFGISKERFDLEIKRTSEGYFYYKASPFLRQIRKEDFARIQDQLFKYPGFYFEKRIFRDYNYRTGSNIFGFIGEVNPDQIKDDPSYRRGDLIGKAGIEKSYEETLRGIPGVKRIMVDKLNREKGRFQNGQYDTLPVPGSDLTTTIDIVLQQYGEELMRNKRGSLVAIEPATGEILALVTSPNFDPNLLVGRERTHNYYELYIDSINKPLYDRALLAEYPPGSTFKVVNALIGLEEGVITPNTTVTCFGAYRMGSLRVGCHCPSGTSISLRNSISKSCNTYYCTIYKAIIDNYKTPQEGLDAWNNHVRSFGLGGFFGNDLSTGRKGFVPDASYFNKAHRSDKWKSLSTISLGIGQGELVVTPLQLANIAAIVANRGFYYTPHIVKKIDGQPIDNEKFTKPNYTTVSEKHFEDVVNGMWDVFEVGTARASRLPDVEMCGKTGTAENPHGQDHSIFISFAPRENPKIAISIIVENGYWGSRWAAPIASLMTELYLTGNVTRKDLEKRMKDGDLSEEYARQLLKRKKPQTTQADAGE